MYPTRASYKPFPLYSFRYMCSTPQKQPAARVHVCAPDGTFMGVAGLLDMLLKGRKNLVRKDMDRYMSKEVMRSLILADFCRNK
jgi:hypothetical protein